MLMAVKDIGALSNVPQEVPQYVTIRDTLNFAPNTYWGTFPKCPKYILRHIEKLPLIELWVNSKIASNKT